MSIAGRVLTVGEALGVLRGVTEGSLDVVAGLEISTGGAEHNVAIALARLGVPVTWAGRVGADSLGRRVVRTLRGEGVEVIARIDEHAPTGLLLKEWVAGRSIVTYHRAASAGSRLRVEDVAELDLRGVEVLHLTGITLAVSAGAREAALGLAARARADGVRVSFDVNHRERLWQAAEAAPHYRRLAELSDLVFASESEVPLVTGRIESVESAATSLLDAGASEVVVTLGPDGCVAALVGGETVRVPALPVTAVDTVGAGDAFVAGYLAGTLRGEDLRGRAEFAVRTAAFACLHRGDWEGSPRPEQLRWLDDAGDPVIR